MTKRVRKFKVGETVRVSNHFEEPLTGEILCLLLGRCAGRLRPTKHWYPERYLRKFSKKR